MPWVIRLYLPHKPTALVQVPCTLEREHTVAEGVWVAPSSKENNTTMLVAAALLSDGNKLM